jgi:hypothetical protein
MESTFIIPGKFQQHAPTQENPTPLPCEFQIYDKVIVDFGSGQKVAGSISGTLFYDPALYYQILVRVLNGRGDERYVHIEVPAGIVFPAEIEETA